MGTTSTSLVWDFLEPNRRNGSTKWRGCIFSRTGEDAELLLRSVASRDITAIFLQHTIICIDDFIIESSRPRLTLDDDSSLHYYPASPLSRSQLNADEACSSIYGPPLNVSVEYLVGPAASRSLVDISLIWNNKVATRLPEAMWMSFVPIASASASE